MQHFTRLGEVDVLPLRLQLRAHPELWNQHSGRTGQAGSAHVDTSDLWLRWRPQSALVAPSSFNEPFAELEWYPAISVLPAARAILMNIMTRIGGTALGGSLITRIPPGGAVLPHSDKAAWHAQYFRNKVYTVLQTNPNALNWCAGESFIPKEGDCFTFDNLLEHSVYNEGDCDRITMMTAIRCD